MKYHYSASFTKEGKWFVARAIEFGVVSQGKTLADAQKNLEEAVSLYLEDQPSSRKLISKTSPMIMMLEGEY